MSLLEEYYQRKCESQPVSKKILFEILGDFTDRRGLRQEWEQIDEDIQESILQDWLEIIERNLKNG